MSVDYRLRGLWQQARIALWPQEEIGVGAQAYQAWKDAHTRPGDSYSMADHVEAHLEAIANRRFLSRFPSLLALFDWLSLRYGRLIADEAFRRALRVLSIE